VGQDGFWRALVDTLRLLVPLDNALVALMRPGHVPRLLIDFDAKGTTEEHEELADYCAGMYLLDPFYQAACAGIADGLHSLESVAPDQFQHSEYYLSYFSTVVGGDELQFMVNVDGAVLGLSLGRATRFSLEEQGRLLCVRDWVLAAMRRHLDLRPPEGPVAEPLAGDLATLLDRFDARLTLREIETARLILQGFSSKAIAQQMGISPETVKVHRRNLYHKLNVNGHGELFALVLRPR
jgi:DNA-binding CsgD family transcriptional regulator